MNNTQISDCTDNCSSTEADYRSRLFFSIGGVVLCIVLVVCLAYVCVKGYPAMKSKIKKSFFCIQSDTQGQQSSLLVEASTSHSQSATKKMQEVLMLQLIKVFLQVLLI